MYLFLLLIDLLFSHYGHAFIQDLPVNAYNRFFPMLPYCFPCPQKVPSKGMVMWSVLFLQTLWFLHFCLPLTILPHSSMPSYPRQSVFLCCLCAPFDITNPSYHVKGRRASICLSIFPSGPFGCDGGGHILDSDRLSETQRYSWFHQNIQYKGCTQK